jgi:tetratricopeptide (TPR) repeat protein
MKLILYILICTLFFCIQSAEAQNIDSLLDKSYENLTNENFELALKQSEQIIYLNPQDSTQIALANCYAAMCKEEFGLTSEALNYYITSVKYKVPRLDTYDRLAVLANKLDNDEAYEFALLEKLNAFPDFELQILDKLSSFYFKSKDYDKLLPVAEKLTDANPGYAKYHYHKAVSLQSMKKIDEALIAYDAALEVNPNHTGANYRKGIILFEKGSEIFEQKKKNYESIADPSRSDYFNYIKSLDSGKDILNQALPHILLAYEKRPNDYLKNVLYKIYFRLEDKENSEKYK